MDYVHTHGERLLGVESVGDSTSRPGPFPVLGRRRSVPLVKVRAAAQAPLQRSGPHSLFMTKNGRE